MCIRDSDKTSLDAAENMLVSMGVAVDTADNGHTAIEMAEAKHHAGEAYPIMIEMCIRDRIHPQIRYLL